ncbi:MAG: [NiFe]-hydrogenase assembly chaperone HybE [Gallionella sp.]
MNPSAQKLHAVFDDIAATRMAGLPICNPALRVEVVGWREWNGRHVAVLVTPWTINLMLMPGSASLASLPLDATQTWEFPSGSYDFMGLNDPALGVCHTCPLVSPTLHIATQEDAVNIAEQIMAQLFVGDQSDRLRDAQRKETLEAARLNGEKISDIALSRRDFLRGFLMES